MAWIQALLLLQAASTPTDSDLRCIYDRLDKAYLSELAGKLEEGIRNESPLLVRFDQAGLSCIKEHHWEKLQAGMAGCYAIMRAQTESLANQWVTDAGDRERLLSILGRAEPELKMKVGRNAGSRDLSDSVRPEVMAYVGTAAPDILERIGDDRIWEIAKSKFMQDACEMTFFMSFAHRIDPQ